MKKDSEEPYIFCIIDSDQKRSRRTHARLSRSLDKGGVAPILVEVC